MKPVHTILLSLALGLAITPLANAQTRTAAATPRPTAPAAIAPTALQVPPSEAQVIMIRSALLALSQANQTNNYTVLNALGSPGFRSANSPTRLSEVFAPFRANRIDLAPVTLINPNFTAKPAIANGRLRLVGLFPTAPMRVNYDLTFEPVGGQWQLFGLAVNLSADAKKN